MLASLQPAHARAPNAGLLSWSQVNENVIETKHQMGICVFITNLISPSD